MFLCRYVDDWSSSQKLKLADSAILQAKLAFKPCGKSIMAIGFSVFFLDIKWAHFDFLLNMDAINGISALLTDVSSLSIDLDDISEFFDDILIFFTMGGKI